MSFDLIGISLKPRVKELLTELREIREGKRPALRHGWMDDLTRAVFDLAPAAPFTKEQRNFTKQLFYSYIYSMGPQRMIDVYREFRK